MRIFSNFDTKPKNKIYNENCSRYWSGCILIFGRSRLCRLLKIFFPTLSLILWSVVRLMIYYKRTDWVYFSYILSGTIALDIAILPHIVWRYIDYLINFMLVLPHALILYSQRWLFERDITTISQNSIKTISVEKRWFRYSIFDNWDITILSEWIASESNINYGKVILKRVAKPEKKREKIIRILWLTNENT